MLDWTWIGVPDGLKATFAEVTPESVAPTLVNDGGVFASKACMPAETLVLVMAARAAED
jgi:hypothetical protein